MSDERVYSLRLVDGARWCVNHDGFVDCDQDVCDVARMDLLDGCDPWPIYVHRPEILALRVVGVES